MNKFSAKKLARAAIIAALYAASTMLLAPISYGAIQFRLSEALCVLAFFYAEAVPGLTIGCLIANTLGNGPLDIIFGTFATFAASYLSLVCSKAISNEWAKYVVCSSFHVLLNAFIVPIAILGFSNVTEGYFLLALQIGIGQLVVFATLGLLFYLIILRIQKSNSLFKNLD